MFIFFLAAAAAAADKAQVVDLLFNVLTLKVAMLQIFLPLNKFLHWKDSRREKIHFIWTTLNKKGLKTQNGNT